MSVIFYKNKVTIFFILNCVLSFLSSVRYQGHKVRKRNDRNNNCVIYASQMLTRGRYPSFVDSL